MQHSPFYTDTELKKSFDFSPWGGIEGFLKASSNGATANNRSVALKRMVPDLSRAVDMTATAISSLPFDIQDEGGEIIDTSSDWQNVIGGIDDPKRLLYLIASSLCGGAAYVIPARTPKYIFELQYVVPHSITPQIVADGLQYFDRTTDLGKTATYRPKEIIYFWLPDSDVEIGPALNTPLSNAMTDSELILNSTNTMRIYGERGFVPLTVLGAKGMPGEAERQKAEGFFTRLLRGGFDELAKIINSDALSIIRIGAGFEELKGAYVEIKRESSESIAKAFGIPSALFMSDNAFASEFDALTRQWYTASRFRSIYQTIEGTINSQLLKQYKKKMVFNLQEMDIFQEDETKRASSLASFVSAVDTSPKIARLGMNILGYDTTEEEDGMMDEIISDKEQAKEKMDEQLNQPKQEAGKPVEDVPMPMEEEEKSYKANGTSSMIALRIPDVIKYEIQEKYPFVDKETLEQLHITLVYLGDNRTIDKSSVVRAVSDLGFVQSPIKGKLQGLARFVSGKETDPIVMTFDSPQAPKLYNTLCTLLDSYHIPYHRDYGFIPHMTLAYIPKDSDMPIETIEPIEINFSEVHYVDGDVSFPVELVGYENKSALALGSFNLSPDEIKDLSLWYTKSKAWFTKGKGTGVDWESKYLREEVAAPIRLKLAGALTVEDIDLAFQIPLYGNDKSADSIQALADAINKAMNEEAIA